MELEARSSEYVSSELLHPHPLVLPLHSPEVGSIHSEG